MPRNADKTSTKPKRTKSRSTPNTSSAPPTTRTISSPNIPTNNDPTLMASIKAMDLRYASCPIICGHYESDAIAGAERQIDLQLLKGALSQYERLGIYADAIGTSTLVLQADPPAAGQQRCGALIVGLGEWSEINAQAITNTVRDAVLRYLLQCSLLPNPDKTHTSLTLHSLLIGHNSTTHITIEASLEAIVRGVAEANQQYRYNRLEHQPERWIGHLEFIELYLDTAMSAAYALRQLPKRLERDMQRLQFRLEPAAELILGQGWRQRLGERTLGSGYWPRLMISNASQADDAPVTPSNSTDAEVQHLPAQRLRYIYLSERARAETIVQQRQPGLIEALIREAIRNQSHDPDMARTLFQLMIPVDFKAALRQTDRLLLALDGYTAALPWEMLQIDEEPLVLKVALVRQLVSTRYRKTVNASPYRNACVIGNPSTAGFYKQFPDSAPPNLSAEQGLVSLTGAAREAREVALALREAEYDVTELISGETDDTSRYSAVDVFNTLFRQPYRILMVAAHGDVNLRGRDGLVRTGVILSDGVLLTAAEISQMETVPDVVFLNCCHLAKIDATPLSAQFNQLAYSLARELIEMGVRCVIAAGWAVDDDAACLFSTTFFNEFAANGLTFGRALSLARKKTYEKYPKINTWGAYQAYGDPNYVLDPNREPAKSNGTWAPVAPIELQDRLKQLEGELQSPDSTYNLDSLEEVLKGLLAQAPDAWLTEPGLQYRLARLYGSLLPDGFDRAEAAYQAALNGADQNDVLPLEVLEWWAKLEARQAALLVQAAQAKPSADVAFEPAALCKKAKTLLDSAIQRLNTLMQLSHASAASEAASGTKRRTELLNECQEQQTQWAATCQSLN